MNLSMESEYLITSQKETATKTARITHMVIPHQVVNGMSSKEYAVVKTETARVTKIITR